jgi:hypothetical protein
MLEQDESTQAIAAPPEMTAAVVRMQRWIDELPPRVAGRDGIMQAHERIGRRLVERLRRESVKWIRALES